MGVGLGATDRQGKSESILCIAGFGLLMGFADYNKYIFIYICIYLYPN